MMETTRRHVGRRYAAQKSMCFSIRVVGMEESAAILTVLHLCISFPDNSSARPLVYNIPVVCVEQILDGQHPVYHHKFAILVSLHRRLEIRNLIRCELISIELTPSISYFQGLIHTDEWIHDR